MHRLETHHVECQTTGYTREIRLWRCSGARQLAVFLDGEHYWRDIGVAPIIAGLIEGDYIPPINALFVSQVSPEDRFKDYLWNENYAEFIGRSLIQWGKQEIPEMEQSGNLVAGLSLSGLEAALIASQYPSNYPNVLCQSASFWWLADHPKPIAQVAKKYWLSVGNQETSTNVAHTESLFQRISQIEGVEGMAKLLRDQGATVRLNEYEGGHALDPWRNEFASALHWLLSTKP